MKLATFHHRGHKSIGEVVEEHTIDLPAVDPKIPPTMLELLWAGRGDWTRDRYKRPDVPARRGALAGGGAEAIQRIIASVSRRQSVTSQPDT